MLLKDETTLITGSTRSIGEKLARNFLKEGAKACICSQNEENVQATVKEFQNSFASDKVIVFRVMCLI